MSRKIKKHYIDYDLDETFISDVSDLEEKEIKKLLEQGKIQSTYAVKTIQSKNIVEVEIYPEFSKADLKKHKEIRKRSNKAQKNLNDKNSKKKLQRLINTNFSENDIWATLTYDSKNLPKTMEEALKNMQGYIRKINRIRKKEGKTNAKYIYITEYSSTRCHHHLIINGDMSLDDIEFNWAKGRRNNARRIHEDENGLDGLALYMTKDARNEKYAKRWNQSKNLKQPKIKKDHKVTMTQIRKMIKSNDAIIDFVNKRLKGLKHKYSKARFNEINKMMYFYSRLVVKVGEGGG